MLGQGLGLGLGLGLGVRVRVKTLRVFYNFSLGPTGQDVK